MTPLQKEIEKILQNNKDAHGYLRAYAIDEIAQQILKCARKALPKKLPKSNESAKYIKGRNDTIDEINKKLGG